MEWDAQDSLQAEKRTHRKHLQSFTYTVPGHSVLQAGDKVTLLFDHESDREGLEQAWIKKVGQQELVEITKELKEEWYGEEEEVKTATENYEAYQKLIFELGEESHAIVRGLQEKLLNILKEAFNDIPRP